MRSWSLPLTVVLLCGVSLPGLAQKIPPFFSPQGCDLCQPLRPGVFQPSHTGDNQPFFIEQQQTSLFSPWVLNSTRVLPSAQVTNPVILSTVYNGASLPATIMTSPAFVSPGTVLITFEALVDLYTKGGGQSVGIFFAYYVEEDSNRDGSFDCNPPGPDSCGYMVQQTAATVPVKYGINGAQMSAFPASPGYLNNLYPFSQTFSLVTTPGLNYRVSAHVWPFHSRVDSPAFVLMASPRLNIMRGPAN